MKILHIILIIYARGPNSYDSSAALDEGFDYLFRQPLSTRAVAEVARQLAEAERVLVQSLPRRRAASLAAGLQFAVYCCGALHHAGAVPLARLLTRLSVSAGSSLSLRSQTRRPVLAAQMTVW